MTFRTRLVATLSAVTALMNVVAFGAASFIVNRSEERQLDRALRNEAREEAVEISEEGGGKALRISDRGGPKADDVGRLNKYAAIYAQSGDIVDHTETFSQEDVPSLATLPDALDEPFDLQYGDEQLRAIVVGVPKSSKSVLLLAASREDLEEDASFLWKVMLMTALFSIGGIVTSSWWVVRRLTRGHMKITEAAHKIASGDLQARVALASGDQEVVQLAKDIDEMVGRLNLVIEGQNRFIAYAAHELRSPLAILYGELQLALRRSRSADEYRTTIEESLEAVRRLNRLVEDLLFLARLTIKGDNDEKSLPLALDEVVARALSWIETAAKRRNVEIDIEMDDDVVVSSAMAIERSLRNLLDNAVRHCREGGRVAVRARKEGDHVELSVRDDGPGIAPSSRERVFEPFFRADDERIRDTGSGLGLAIVREIARAHGGDASVEEAEGGEGALFRVRFRLSPREVESRSEANESATREAAEALADSR